eukprot:XP_001694006.1 deoxycytidyl transferase [Chlamydomonas reinhardtii]
MCQGPSSLGIGAFASTDSSVSSSAMSGFPIRDQLLARGPVQPGGTTTPGRSPGAAGNAASGQQQQKQPERRSEPQPAAQSMHHGGSFSGYMELKVQKLREQYDAQQLQHAAAAKSDIFRGVSIHVNGLTNPSHAELKQLMALHGGRFENYLYRDAVTHIVCAHLPDTKIKQLAKERNPIPHVRPEWIVASIAAGRLLPAASPAPPLQPGQSPRAHSEVAAELRAASDAVKGPPRSTRTDPRFMETFFRNSRLHFIGTWRTRIEALMAEVEAAAPQPLPPAARGAERVVLHVDMDCFFASVAAVGRPELAGRPLAVCHSNSGKGTGEVSSANYVARSYGIRADMFMGEAKRLCPDLAQPQPHTYGDPAEALAARLRADIAAATGCTASAGIGPNMLVARLATRRAKPNGQFRGCHTGLVGVGWSTADKLDKMGITSVRQLQKALGAKLGSDLWAHAHGQDERRVEPPKARKSVGAEVNYGIRFTTEEEAERFMGDLAAEVAARLKTAGVKGRSLTLKAKRRLAGAPEPAKFMGHGACDNISRSMTLGRFTDDAADLRREAVALLRALAVPAAELRGLGLTVSRLDSDPAAHTSRPSAPAAAKLQAPPRRAFDASKPPPWVVDEEEEEVAEAEVLEVWAEGSGRPEGHQGGEGGGAVSPGPASRPRPQLQPHPRPPVPMPSASAASSGLSAGGPQVDSIDLSLDVDDDDAEVVEVEEVVAEGGGEIDPAVLAELPPDVRREVERAYGTGWGAGAAAARQAQPLGPV